MTFSGILTLTDLNDFIAPSQACIKPVEQVKSEPSLAATEIRIDSSGSYYEVSSTQTQRKLEQAQVNLNDCLACSGCITSAESVLITSQSHAEVLAFLAANDNKAIPVISVSPQSLASLAASLSASNPLSPPIALDQVLHRIRLFCKQALGFAYLFDTTFARHISLREHIKEYEERRRHDPSSLPMMASACPGWICYVEKAHSECWLGEKWGKKPHEIYHVTVMPCYDKKLEASRQDFYNEEYSTRDVDCVITTGELEQLMRDKGWDLFSPVDGEDDDENPIFPELLQHPGSSSGSYLQVILNHVMQTWPVPLELSIKTVRNADFEEHTLQEREGGKIVFKGAKCYGFRNLQNIVRKVGKEKGIRVGAGAAGRIGGRRPRKGPEVDGEKKYDYLEVMACAGGCVNGGGQLKLGEGYREWTKKVEEAYWRGAKANVEEMGNGIAAEIMSGRLDFRTQYRAVESDVIGTAVKW